MDQMTDQEIYNYGVYIGKMMKFKEENGHIPTKVSGKSLDIINKLEEFKNRLSNITIYGRNNKEVTRTTTIGQSNDTVSRRQSESNDSE